MGFRGFRRGEAVELDLLVNPGNCAVLSMAKIFEAEFRMRVALSRGKDREETYTCCRVAAEHRWPSFFWRK